MINWKPNPTTDPKQAGWTEHGAATARFEIKFESLGQDGTAFYNLFMNGYLIVRGATSSYCMGWAAGRDWSGEVLDMSEYEDNNE